MARVQLLIADPALRLTVKAVLEAEGHAVDDSDAEVLICDDRTEAVERAQERPVLLLTSFAEIRNALEAMRRGVYGYVLVPLEPGEAALMVERAQRAAVPDTPLIPLEEVERRHIEAVLRACNGNQAEAARVLGIGRNTLWRKRKKDRARTEEG